MRTSRADDPLLGSPLEKPYPMSPGVLRSCRSSKWCALRSPRLTHTGFSTTGANRWTSPTSESPGATRTPSCLGSSAATSRTPEVVLAGGGRCALRRVPYVASIKSASETPTPLSHRPFVLHSVPSRAPNAAAVASELRCTHGLGAHPRLAKGMSRRLQQSTIFIFQRRTPTSCIDDSTTPEPLGRAPVEESLRSRRGSRFGASMRCHPVVGRVNRIDGSSDIPSHLELRRLDRAPASQGRCHRATRDGSSSAFTAWDTFGRDPTSALLPP
jgi:hypothetical protein